MADRPFDGDLESGRIFGVDTDSTVRPFNTSDSTVRTFGTDASPSRSFDDEHDAGRF